MVCYTNKGDEFIASTISAIGYQIKSTATVQLSAINYKLRIVENRPPRLRMGCTKSRSSAISSLW